MQKEDREFSTLDRLYFDMNYFSVHHADNKNVVNVIHFALSKHLFLECYFDAEVSPIQIQSSFQSFLSLAFSR